MKKAVFFTDLNKLHEALDYFDIQSFANRKVPVKLHMGEVKNKYFTKPDFVKLVISELKLVNADPFLFDTTVAYNSLRRTKQGYEKVASMHGFTEKNIGCGVIIGDKGMSKTIENRTFDVALELVEASHILALSHVKGHIQAGFGGAIKNLGMGSVTRETKIRMHDGSRPVYFKDKCTLCGTCAEVCPFHAIDVAEEWKYSERECFGCGVCVDLCKSRALGYTDTNLQYLLVLSMMACVRDKNVIYVNELKRIARSCDCDPFAGPIICPDIGYLVSDDPVAIDKASLDLINGVKENVFEKVNKVSPLKQIKYGEEIGLGSSSYQLIEL